MYCGVPMIIPSVVSCAAARLRRLGNSEIGDQDVAGFVEQNVVRA